MQEYIEKHCDQICGHCGYIEKENDSTLKTEGMPISGTYDVCPKCGKYWEYIETNVVEINMVRMTADEYYKLVK